ncbi:hypothetical protein PsorP6_008987 [Peronosclerospora sorghi]|uniref:Uncharacterized protein n=1 Tax=Peronosclerospora sorghi TaxID=230839 RepID=A0ACC0W044_9STRA|nr:hypothetical protein PsorP6_008987 [Peronosclerospora sorghi]
MHLQTQLPVAAIDSLDRVTDSVISLSGAEFIEFWRSLLAKELEEAAVEASGKGAIQTPCTSPVDYTDASYVQSQLSTSHHRHDPDESSTSDRSDDEFEPGWAIEYMEQDSGIPSEMSRRMAKIMHSNVATNLFRATVSLNDDRSVDMGALTPGSFPPTPITRDLQKRRMHHYTVTVLNHATLTLRLLTEKSYDT